MGYVHGHWRTAGWVRGHFRHPHRPGPAQSGLVLLAASPVRIDLRRHPGAGACCPLAARPAPAVPEPRRPPEVAAPARRPG